MMKAFGARVETARHAALSSGQVQALASPNRRFAWFPITQSTFNRNHRPARTRYSANTRTSLIPEKSHFFPFFPIPMFGFMRDFPNFPFFPNFPLKKQPLFGNSLRALSLVVEGWRETVTGLCRGRHIAAYPHLRITRKKCSFPHVFHRS
jgi:hypothetical protein